MEMTFEPPRYWTLLLAIKLTDTDAAVSSAACFFCPWQLPACLLSHSNQQSHGFTFGTLGHCYIAPKFASANNQSQSSLLLSRLMNDQAKTRNIVVNSSTNSIKNTSCDSLDNILQLLLLRIYSLPFWRGHVFAVSRNQSEFIKFTTAGWMIGSDIFLTFLWIFDLCTNYERGPHCTCRWNQSVHKRLKIIHLNFQNMELTSVHHNSAQLFQRINVVHVISVQPQEVVLSGTALLQVQTKK